MSDLAQLNTLGAPQAIYKRQQVITHLFTAMAFFGVGLVLFLGPILTNLSPSYHATNTNWSSFIPFLGLGLLFMIPSGLLAYRTFRNRSEQLAVSAEGVVRSNGDDPVTVLRWSEVQQFYLSITKHYRNGVYTGTTHYYTLVDKTGRKLELSHLDNMEKLGQQIEQAVLPRLLHELTQQISNGETVDFGPFRVNKTELIFGSKSLPWSDVSVVAMDKGKLTIGCRSTRSSWASKTVNQIPNVMLFAALGKQLAERSSH